MVKMAVLLASSTGSTQARLNSGLAGAPRSLVPISGSRMLTVKVTQDKADAEQRFMATEDQVVVCTEDYHV